MALRSITPLALVCLSLSMGSSAQTLVAGEIEGGGQYPLTLNDAAHPCITPGLYAMMDKRMADNLVSLKRNNIAAKTTSTLFAWPMRMASGFTDCGYYYIGNYVDEDATAGIKDYNCGSVSYDGHRGTDICSAPYPFLKMDNNDVEGIAAAPGTIIDKQDGHFDKNCAFNTDTANYVIIQHADGSCALYWHFKKNSVTTKLIGQTVALGEYLGVLGSSGSSTAPHLHFEVWATSSSASLRDPWAGTCNSLGGTTWWTAQKPYTESALLHAQVNNALVVLPTCPATETPNEDSCFTAGGSAKFYFFLRNETPGDTVYERIINPGGASTFSSWTHNCITSYLASYWYFIKPLPTTPGIYTYEAKYRGVTCTKDFKVNCSALGIPKVADPAQMQVFPNPANTSVTVAIDGVEDGNYTVVLRNIVGQTMVTEQVIAENNLVQKTISITALPGGVYFLSLESGKTRLIKKVIRQD